MLAIREKIELCIDSNRIRKGYIVNGKLATRDYDYGYASLLGRLIGAQKPTLPQFDFLHILCQKRLSNLGSLFARVVIHVGNVVEFFISTFS